MSRAWSFRSPSSRRQGAAGTRAWGARASAVSATVLLCATLLPSGGRRRILVVANETVGGEALRDEIRRRAAKCPLELRVVCPALNSRLRRWLSDEDRARTEAWARLEDSLAALAEDGIDAQGEVGDADPVQAIEDALRTFSADELIISTHPAGRSNWLERGLIPRASQRFRLPITHVIVDLESEREKAARRERV